MEHQYLVIYDIADNKRLNKTASVLLDYGLRLQKSVFELSLNEETLRRLLKRLNEIIEPKEDGIKIFRLCEICLGRRHEIGSITHLQKSPAWTII